MAENDRDDKIIEKLTASADRNLRNTANETIVGNCKSDPRKPKWARVPSSSNPCEWCCMLASRGFDYTSEDSARAGSHDHCSCAIVPGFDDEGIEGYDPQKYYDLWKSKERYIISDSKLAGYSLKDKNKSEAFRRALGFSVDDKDNLASQIYIGVAKAGLKESIVDRWGQRYYSDIIVRGNNLKTAVVRTAWIDDGKSDRIRLVSAYVK